MVRGDEHRARHFDCYRSVCWIIIESGCRTNAGAGTMSSPSIGTCRWFFLPSSYIVFPTGFQSLRLFVSLLRRPIPWLSMLLANTYSWLGKFVAVMCLSFIFGRCLICDELWFSRRYLALKHLDEESEPLRKFSRQSKYEVGSAEWNPTIPNCHLCAISVSTCLE